MVHQSHKDYEASEEETQETGQEADIHHFSELRQ